MADKASADKQSAGKSLNEQNWPGLLAITALNFVVFAMVAGIASGWDLDKPDTALKSLLAAITSKPTPDLKAWMLVLPAGVGLAMIRVINGLLNQQTKERLVFWKRHHPLPGCEAFTVHIYGDDRFTAEDVFRALGKDLKEIGQQPRKQNKVWYSEVFVPVQNSPSVQQANRNFLFARDYAAISFIMLIALGIAGYLMMNLTAWSFYVGGLVIQYLLVRWAARNYGIETVTNAFAAMVGKNSARFTPR